METAVTHEVANEFGQLRVMASGTRRSRSSVSYARSRTGSGTRRGSPTKVRSCIGITSPSARSARRFHCHAPVAGSTTLTRCASVPWIWYPPRYECGGSAPRR